MKKTKRALFSSVVALILCFSMLLGTTFAWFTDSVESGKNQIVAGNLDIELYWSDDAATWRRVDEKTNIFKENTLWEPGHTEVVYLKIVNEGTLALKYQLGINVAGETGSVNVLGEEFKLSQHIRFGVAAGEKQFANRNAAVEAVDATATALNQAYTSDVAKLASKDEQIVTLVVYMPTSVDNEANHAKGAPVPTINLGIRLQATQVADEMDSFGPDYDENATFPELKPGSITADISGKVQGSVLTEAVAMVSEDGAISAVVPAGTKVSGNSLILSVSELSATGSNITLQENEILRPMDVHIEGVAQDNQEPILVTVKEAMMKGLNIGNYTLYHVEQSGVKVMTAGALDQHNGFAYDPATGDVTVALATFSEVALVAEPAKWEGNFDYSWYTNAAALADGEAVTEYIIANADQLAAFGAIVGGMNGKTADSFKDKTVKLIADINLGDKESENNSKIIFYPIGYYNSEGTYERTNTAITSGLRNFEGTFDGNGHTISNFYHNTWEMKGDHNWYSPEEQYYRDGMGLFGRVYKGTVKNLTVKNFSSDGEIATTGVIAAYADGATFENIAIFDCNPRVYNIGNGGIVGCVGWYAKEADLKTTFKNITVDNSNKISALWGSYDVACGGIVGQYYPTSGQTSKGSPVNGGVHFENCHISAQMDVYNDVCANYQYYAYRYTGMLIGSVRENVTIDGRSYPKMDGITAEGCTVHFGTWNDYYYCEIIDNTTASYTHDYQMSRLTEIKAINGTTITYLDGTTGTVPASGRANYVIVDYTKGHSTENATCYHFKDGAVWTHDMGGIQTGIDENGDGQDDLKEDKQHIYLEFNNLVTGYGWGVTTKGVGDLAGVTILDREVADSVNKFKPVIGSGNAFTTETTVTIGELFAALDKLDVAIKSDNVQVTVSPFGTTSTAGGTYVANTTDWTQGTLTFSGVGQAVITITDYYFCKTASITINVVGAEKFDTNFVNYKEYLYRVGNASGSTVALGTIFKHSGKGTINSANVSVAFETIGGNASGTFTANTSDWTKGTIQFTDTGVVKVTIKDDTSKEFVLYLEVVDAKNITSAVGSDGTDVVLLNDVKVSANGTANYKNCNVYGNGFTFDVRGGMNQYNSKQGHGIIIINNATLDHLRIVGDVYDEYGMYTTSDLKGTLSNDYTGAVDATNSIIQNCYIANCAAPIRANGITLIDSTLYGGTIANLLISGGTNTLTNVTTVNYNDGRGVIGMGIVITDGANVETTKLILDGYLKQYNYVYNTDVDTISLETAKTVFNSMFGTQFSAYHIGSNPKAVNTGIISINEEIKLGNILKDGAKTGYVINDGVSVTVSAQGMSKTINSSVASVPSNGTVDNNVEEGKYAQGDYLPTPEFDLGDQLLSKDNDDDTNYLIGDINGLEAMYVEGSAGITIDLSALMKVYKYDGVYYTVSSKCLDYNGNEITATNNKVTLTDKGTYTLVFAVDDNIFYDENGTAITKSVIRTYEVPLTLSVYEKSVADAKIEINSDFTGEYKSSGTSYYYQFYPLNAIRSIMDDANKDGTLEDFSFKSNISTATISSVGDNAFSGATTIVVTYSGGQVLTIVLGVPTGLSSPSATNGGKTLSVHTDSTNGIYVKSDGKTSAKDGTWPITSISFKGTSGKEITTTTTSLNITFKKPSCVTGDTLVTLADGTQKRIDQVTYADKLLVWDFDKGEYTAVTSTIIENHGYDWNDVIKLTFEDGTQIKVVNYHGFFDADLNKWVDINATNAQNYIGHSFTQVNGDSYKTVKLVSVEVTTEYVEAWAILTADHYNCVLEGMFSITPPATEQLAFFEIGEGMKYDAEAKQADIEKYGLYTYEKFAHLLTYEQFDALNVPEIKVAVGKGLITYEEILWLIKTYIHN